MKWYTDDEVRIICNGANKRKSLQKLEEILNGRTSNSIYYKIIKLYYKNNMFDEETFHIYSAQYYVLNKDKILKRNLGYRKNNKSKVKEWNKNRRKKRTYKKAGKVLTERLDSFGKTQTWLALKMNVSKEAVSRWIRGINAPRFKRRNMLARALEMSYEELNSLYLNNF